jgi:predicted anti-sigma-YlaC factor YlaD
VTRRAPRRLFEQARIPLEEEDVVEEVEAERAKVKEGRYQPPVLRTSQWMLQSVLGAQTWLLKKTVRTL